MQNTRGAAALRQKCLLRFITLTALFERDSGDRRLRNSRMIIGSTNKANQPPEHMAAKTRQNLSDNVERMMYVRVPNTPTPVGCLIGFFAILAATFSAFAFWGAHKAFGQAPPETEIGAKLIRWGIVSALPAVAGLAYSIYRIATVGNRDHHRIGQSLST